ncbi:MAG: M48 family metallopeptidase [Lentisphaeraceae bacterium]|nr:M48 family metallopeptidase [Lentisphaeraceae bacterium]
MIYEGHAFHESFSGGKASGRIQFVGNSIHYENDEKEVSLQLDGLKVELGGASNRVLFLSHPLNTEWKLFTSDLTILKDPAFTNNHDLHNQVSKVRKSRNTAVMIGLGVLFLFFASIAYAWFQKDAAIGAAVEQIPVEWEVKLGDSAFGQFTSGKRLLKDKELESQLDELLAPLMKEASNERFKYKFHIVEDSTLNAAAFPGGNMIIHTGLILKLENSEQLLGVLAHEMAHVNRRHSMKTLVNNAGLYIVLDTMVGGFGALSGVILNGGSQLLLLKNSRSHEKDADEIGWEYLVKGGIDPRGLIESFKIMEESLSDDMKEYSESLDFLSTHPALGDRVSYLENKWDETRKSHSFRPLSFDYKLFQKSIRKNLEESLQKESMPEVNEKEVKE